MRGFVLLLQQRKNLVADIVFLAVLLGLSIFLISFYLNAESLNPSYPDWIVHAFRIKALQSEGLVSWTHVWSNGISFWKAYQFIPHLMSVGVINLLDVSVTRGMVLITIGSFILLRFFIYGVLRALHYSPITAFICAILSFDIAQYWGGVADFSLLFGFTFFPLIVLLWVKFYEGKLQLLFPYIVGISFHMHPILGYTSFGLFLTAVVFSNRKIITPLFFVQMIIFLLSSSLFWFPIAFKASYSYTSSVFANKYFLTLVLSAYKYYGLSIFILCCLGASFVRMFMPFQKEYKWVRAFFIFILTYFIFVVIGLTIDLPKFIAQLQFTRGATIIGIGIIIVFASVIESVARIKSLALKGLLLFIFSLAIIEGLWFTSEYSPPPATESFSEPISAFNKLYPEKDIVNKRVWSSYIGLSSYLPPLTAKLPYSYMGHLDSNQLSPRLSPLLLYQPYPDTIPTASLNRINDYFKVGGVQYALFDDNAGFTKTLTTQEVHMYKDLGTITDKNATYHAFEMPWEVRNAVSIHPSLMKYMKQFPYELELTEINDQIELDLYIKNFADVLYNKQNIPLQVSYPTSTSLNVSVTGNRPSQYVYLNESYDAGWKATYNEKPVKLTPVGPNFTMIQLPDNTSSGVVSMIHSWPLQFYVCFYLIALIPIQILLYNLFLKYVLKKNAVPTT